MNEKDKNSFLKKIDDFCFKYQIPIEYLFDILEDQKVIPMIRGKTNEFNAYLKLINLLPRNLWSIEKLNLNPQPGSDDEDISVTHKKSGRILKIESKTAVRGSFTLGVKTKIVKAPHFKVKCHRSRSNITLAQSSNDRYAEDVFDIIITNPLNSLYKGKTLGDNFEFIGTELERKFLFEYYKVKKEEDLIVRCYNDWRFVIPSDIAVNGFLPRTPYVKFKNDNFWKSISELEESLLKIVKLKKSSGRR